MQLRSRVSLCDARSVGRTLRARRARDCSTALKGSDGLTEVKPQCGTARACRCTNGGVSIS
ncbi:hypothetical protein A8H40_07650 [Burkholderia multivorans]|uniref:Uncharacterized protein n=1 Tax=Burkholderia multivorans CGD2 TaxID=513052 RepID=B9BIT6_9BURK|nr:hypothetical protein A8H40_07650 [Burkholderia multivorans]EEE09619.1 hypothetical protein BURMUCGD2_4992 [Burkholderia multivorans CGD2]EEE15542.1 hypothetical protein BURMUCGD2M_4985 [Burkholderia multivorans CGD2M]PRF18196.1 hypothetical protein C6Q03_27080 [Burkholderia multivorans]PRF78586.1 hypothetical protein C6Q22_29645 [Burkholderia multivorans]